MSNTYTIVFNFSKTNGATPLNAALSIQDSNTFSLAQGPAQLQPYGQSYIPKLQYFNVFNNRFDFSAADGDEAQSLSIVAALDAIGTQMQVKLQYESEDLRAQYSFLGHSGIHSLVYGNNVIAFPTS